MKNHSVVSSEGMKQSLTNCFKSSNSTAKSEEDTEMLQQLKDYKCKAHQSFLQVTQMENLHEEQLQLLKHQHAEQMKQQKVKQQQLMAKIRKYEEEQIVNRKFALETSNISFHLDAIEEIDYKDSQESRFDDSSILHLRQILAYRDSNSNDKLKPLQNQMRKEIQNCIQTGNLEYLRRGFIDKIFAVFNQINTQNVLLKDKLQDAQRKPQKAQSQLSTVKIQYQSSQKENKFLSDHIKKVLDDKMKLQKKVLELEKSKQNLEEKLLTLRKDYEFKLTKASSSACLNRRFSEQLYAWDQNRMSLDLEEAPNSQQQRAEVNRAVRIISESKVGGRSNLANMDFGRKDYTKKMDLK